jgi:hypothetical protein
MSQQTINVGAAPNDGTGTPLRTAFQYTNSNFTELYAALGGGTGLPGASTQVIFNDGGSNLAGDAGMTYNKTTDTLSLVNLILSGNTTLGDAQTDTATINAQLTARQGEFPSAVRAAASNYAAVNFDGATASTRITSTLTGQNIGTGDFSLWSRFRVPTSFAGTPGLLWLTDAGTGTFRANAIGIYLETTFLRVFRYGTTPATDSRIATVASFLTNFAGQVVDVVVTRAGNTLKIYINGTDTAYTETTGGAAPAWGQTVVSDFALVGALNSSSIFTGRIYRSVVFNRALSAADVTELITTGVNPADQWGTQTAVLTSDFSAGVDSFAGLGGAGNSTLAGNIDGIGGQDDNLRVTTGTFALNIAGAFRLVLSRAKRFLVTYSYYIPSTNVTLRGVRTSFFNNGTAGEGPAGNTTLDAWTTVSELSPPDVANAGSNNGLSFHATNSSSAINYTGTSGDVMYLRAITLTRIGAIVDLDFTVGVGYQATDRSTNALHGTLFNGVAFTEPKRVAVLYATTATNGNQQMLGTLAIPTNAIIEDIIVNSTGSATVSVGNASAGAQIVNGASVVSGRQKLTIATPFSTTGNLWVNSNATATLQFTILYTIAS